MSYTASLATTGNLALFAIKTGSSTFTNIFEITEASQSGKTNKTADVTNLNSTGEEFIATLLSPGTIDLTMNRVSTDPGQIAVKASFDAKTVVQYQVTLPELASQTVAGDVITFHALVEEFEDISSVSSTKQLVTKVKLKITGPVVMTAGS